MTRKLFTGLLCTLFLASGCQKFLYYNGPIDYSLKGENSFWIFFGDGFEDDPITLTINDKVIFERKILKHPVDDESILFDPLYWMDRNTYVKFRSDSLVAHVVGNEQLILGFKSSKILRIKLIKNEEVIKRTINIKRNPYIEINDSNYRMPDRTIKRKILIRQSKKPIAIED